MSQHISSDVAIGRDLPIRDITRNEVVTISLTGDPSASLRAVVVDGTPWIAFRHMMESLGMVFRRRNVDSVLRRTPEMCALMGAHDATGRRKQDMIMVTAEAARAWLFSVNTNRVGEGVRPKLIEVQRHWDTALAQWSETGVAVNPMMGQPPASSPAKQRDSLETLRSVVDELIAQRDAIQEVSGEVKTLSGEVKTLSSDQQVLSDAQQVTAIEAGEANDGQRVANARIDAHEGQHGWYAGLGWAKKVGIPYTGEGHLRQLGVVAGTIGRRDGLTPDKVPHARYGTQNSWPEYVWAEAAQLMGWV